MGKVFNNKECRRRIKRAVVKSLSVLNDNHMTDDAAGGIAELVPVAESLQDDNCMNAESVSGKFY